MSTRNGPDDGQCKDASRQDTRGSIINLEAERQKRKVTRAEQAADENPDGNADVQMPDINE